MADNEHQGRTTTAGEVLDRSRGRRSEHGKGGLAGLSGKLGNDELLERIGQGNASRDELLDFLVNRLESMRSAQLAEIALTRKSDSEFMNLLSQQAQAGNKLDPTRWVDAARLYEQAARALCAGQLHRGTELVEQAVKADQKAYDEVSVFVRIEEARAEAPSAVADVSSDTACTDRPEPPGVEVAYEIQRVTNDGRDDVRGQRRELDPWWTELEDEEEEEEAGNA